MNEFDEVLAHLISLQEKEVESFRGIIILIMTHFKDKIYRIFKKSN